MMVRKEVLIDILNGMTQEQLKNVNYYFGMIGFYQEDKRRSLRKHLIECVKGSYTDQLIMPYKVYDEDSVMMEKSILDEVNKK